MKMTLSASLLLLLLLGLSQAKPIEEEDEKEDEGETVDITTAILNTNKGSDEFLLEGDMSFPSTRNAIRCWFKGCLWKKGHDGTVKVPYSISSEFNTRERRIIENGMMSFHSISCLRFVPLTNERDFLQIENRGGCFSPLGREGGGQVISLSKNGCIYQSIVQHEILHSLGFRHEHNRSDRDKFVKIIWNNIEREMAYNFEKQNTNNLNVGYDYSSIMHYGKTAFSVDGRLQTIIPIPDASVRIGQRQGLSFLDIKKLNMLYNC